MKLELNYRMHPAAVGAVAVARVVGKRTRGLPRKCRAPHFPLTEYLRGDGF